MDRCEVWRAAGSCASVIKAGGGEFGSWRG